MLRYKKIQKPTILTGQSHTLIGKNIFVTNLKQFSITSQSLNFATQEQQD